MTDTVAQAAQSDREAFTARMRVLVERVGGIGELARLTGLSRRAVQNYLTGANDPSREVVLRLARAAKVSVGWLAAGEAAESPGSLPPAPPGLEQVLSSPHYAFVPTLAPMGEGHRLGMDTQAPLMALFVDRRWLSTQIGIPPEQAALITAVDDQMAPTILPGYVMLVDLGDRTVGNGIYMLEEGARMAVKRLQVIPDGILVGSDNPRYESYRLSADDAKRLRIFGRVRVLWRPWRL